MAEQSNKHFIWKNNDHDVICDTPILESDGKYVVMRSKDYIGVDKDGFVRKCFLVDNRQEEFQCWYWSESQYENDYLSPYLETFLPVKITEMP